MHLKILLKNSMVILGLDPGTAIVGYGVLNKKSKRELVVLEYGCLTTPAGQKPSKRLLSIEKQLRKVIKDFKPDEAVVEKLFFFKNLKTAIAVSEARGVILAELERQKVKVFEHTPLEIKQAVTGYGRASKIQVQKMVQNILKLDKLPKPDDAADALAAAICHVNAWRK